MVFCPECGKPVATRAKFCRNCGASQIEETQEVPVVAPAPAAAPAPEKILCKFCNSPLAPDEKFCGNCGARAGGPTPPSPAAAPAAVPVPPAPAPASACPSCGTPYAPGTRFCGSCGAAIGQATATPASVPVTAPPASHPTSAPAPGSVRLCTACGNPIKPGEKYCSQCLVMVKDNAPAAPVAAAPAASTVAVPPAQPDAVPAAAIPGGVRLCTACGNPIKPGEKYCSKCLVMVKDNAPAASVAAAPAAPTVALPQAQPVAAPAAPGGYVCASCGSPLSGTEKFCGVCGGPAVGVPAQAPAAAPAGKFCGTCGAPVSDTTRFCGGCGAPVGASFPAGQIIPTPPPGSEPVMGVILNARKMKMLGAAWDTYTIVITPQRSG